MSALATKPDRTQQARAVLDAYNPRMFNMFSAYLDRYFGRKFDAVRVLNPLPAAVPADRAGVFYSNHSAWWDPILLMLLSAHFTPGRRAFGPMDANALKKYGFMKWIGMFGVEQDSPRGAAQFLTTARAILNAPDTGIWMTPQGQFKDVRDRPIKFKSGLAHLARDGHSVLVPIAIELVFWEESKPETLVAFGEPVDTRAHEKHNAVEWNAILEQSLETAMDKLAAAARARDPSAFTTIVEGRSGVNPIYDGWRYLKAMVRGERFSATHKD